MRRYGFPVLVLLLGATLRISLCGQDVRFHGDEALYATYARRMSLHGDFLLSDVPLDKPPLGIGLTALSFALLGSTEFAARVPTLLISLLQLALIFPLARRLYDPSTACFAMLLLALAPMDIAFAPTAFHDPALSLMLLLVAWLGLGGRWRMAGVAAASALWIKQSAVQFLPILIVLALLPQINRAWWWRDYWRRARRFVVPLLIGALLLALWSAARDYPVDFWTLGVTNPGLLRFIRDDEVLPRLGRWLFLLSTVIGCGPLLVLATVPGAAALFRGQTRAHLVDLTLSIGVWATLFAYWLLAFNTYDRYLFPLVPLIVLLVARAWRILTARWARPVWSIVIAVLILALIVPYSLAATRGQSAVGGDKGTFTGIDTFAAALNSQLPPKSIVYDFWLGWELGFYLGEPPTVTVLWVGSPEWLAREVCSTDDARYFVAPEGKAQRWLGFPGLKIAPILRGKFELYQIACDKSAVSGIDPP